MADPGSIDPYQDLIDSQFVEDVLRLFGDSNAADLSLDTQQNQLPPNSGKSSSHPPTTTSVIRQPDSQIMDPCDPLNDPLIWNMYHDSILPAETSTPQVDQEQLPESMNTGYVNAIPLEIWPPPILPFNCSCCQVLREINHTKDTQTTKLEIHGRVGIICHAILQITTQGGGVDPLSVPNKEHRMIDFCNQSMESVKQFLVQYCQERKKAGYVMLQDPLSIFYGALCAGLIWEEENANPDEFAQQPQTDSGACEMIEAEAESEAVRLPKSSIAAQRERTGKMTLQDLGSYFPLPIEMAARELSICPTVLKKICRKHGMPRWPHRKIKSLDRRISNLQQSLTALDGEGSEEIRAKIEELQLRRARLCAGEIS